MAQNGNDYRNQGRPQGGRTRQSTRGGRGGQGSAPAFCKSFQPRCDDDHFDAGPVCMAGVVGECQSQDRCQAGQHPRRVDYLEMAYPSEETVLTTISRAKLQLLQAKWTEAGGTGQLYGAWQVQNRRLGRLFRATAHNLALELGRTSDMIDGWHGTPEENVYPIAVNGFDPNRRAGQVYGAGEYFAKSPLVSISYARGGSYMFLCKLLLGAEQVDHTWVDDQKYYVVKQRKSYVQALPVYLVQFAQPSLTSRTWLAGPPPDSLAHWLSLTGPPPSAAEASTLQYKQRGGQSACVARRDAGMLANSTRHLWLGWLAPELASATNDDIHDDVCRFLVDLEVEEVLPERNGARIGAYVRLAATSALSKAAFREVARRKYRDEFTISVDDAQPGNPMCAGKACPRLTGPSGYCRGWNISGHASWQWGCPFDHPLDLRPTHGAAYSLEEVPPKTAKFDEIETAFSDYFHDGTPRIVGVSRVVNPALQRMYDQRRDFLEQKHGFTVEKELWHGTNCKAIPELLTHGLQPPSDTAPGAACPKSGGKGLCTTLCAAGCKHCTEPHDWNRCHMYGLGVYLADLAQKSHRYVREPERRKVAVPAPERGVGGFIESMGGEPWGRVTRDNGACWQLESGRIAKKENENIRWRWRVATGVGAIIVGLDGEEWGEVVGQNSAKGHWQLKSGRIAKMENEGVRWNWKSPGASEDDGPEMDVYSMLFCRVALGNPYLIEGNLLKPEAMHDVCWCQDPGEQLETVAEDWSLARGHDSFYVRGLSGTQRQGLGVYNSEYIVFQPFQVLPLYKVDYVME